MSSSKPVKFFIKIVISRQLHIIGNKINCCSSIERNRLNYIKIGMGVLIFIEENKHYLSIFLSTSCLDKHQVKDFEPDKISSWERININLLPDNLFLSFRNLILEKEQPFLLDLSKRLG